MNKNSWKKKKKRLSDKNLKTHNVINNNIEEINNKQNQNNNNNNNIKYFRRVQTYKPMPVYPIFEENIYQPVNQNAAPQIGMYPMNMQQPTQPMMGYPYYFVPVPLNNNYGVYQNNNQNVKGVYQDNKGQIYKK